MRPVAGRARRVRLPGQADRLPYVRDAGQSGPEGGPVNRRTMAGFALWALALALVLRTGDVPAVAGVLALSGWTARGRLK